MGKKSTPKAPAAPDYAAAATAQGQANVDAARTGAELNNVNQYTPYGNQVFTKDPNSDQWSSTVTLSPEQQQLYNLQTQGDASLGRTAVDQLGRVSSAMSQPLDLSGAPDRVNSVSPGQYSSYSGSTPSYQRVGSGPTYSQVGAGPAMGQVGSGPAMGQVGSGPSYSETDAGPTYATYTGSAMALPDYAKQAQEVEDSIYSNAATKLDPQFAQQEEALRSRLINSGVAEGSEQYQNAFDDFNRQKQQAYGDARDRAIQARGAEQSRLNNDFYTGNQQQFNQSLQSLGFNNDSSARGFADTLARNQANNSTRQQSYADALAGQQFNNSAAQQQYNNSVASQQFNNSAAQQQYANELSGGQFNNTSRQQQYADALTGANFNNTQSQQELSDQLRALGFNNDTSARQFSDAVTAGNFQNNNRGAAIDEAAYMRNDPLNTYNALMNGVQITNPQFRGTAATETPAATPTFAATQAQDQRAVDLYNAQLASSGSAQSGLFGMLGSLGGAAINQWSDRRLKTSIKRLGTRRDGLNVYSYRIFGKPEIGVMADEVRKIYPSAVTRDASGYDKVDYSQLQGN